MDNDMTFPIIDPASVESLMKKPDVVIVDARGGADALQRYMAGHLEGAVRLDLETELSEKASDASNGGRHPLPDPEKFGAVGTYNSFERDGKTPTYGGYSRQIVVDENFVLKVPGNLALEAVAPLLCAGITTYSPLKHWRIGKGHKVGVLGLGGLGHMALKFASAFGAEVTMLSTSPAKEADSKRLGAHRFVLTTDPDKTKAMKNYFDFIIDTVSAPHDYNMYLKMLTTNGVHICVGAPPTPSQFRGMTLIGNRRSIAGSSIGGIPETQEMLDFCSSYQIVSDVELISIKDINEAYERMLKGDVRYRFVIDMSTL